MVDWLFKWQSLLGAIIGGIFALGVALLVSYKASRREELTAAMLVVANLVTVKAAAKSLDELSQENGIEEKDIPYWMAEKLVQRRVKLSPMFEVSRIKLMPNDVLLAAHLELFQFIMNDVEMKLDALETDYRKFQVSGAPDRDSGTLMLDSEIIHSGFVKAAKHASCAERLISLKILSPYRIFHSLRIRLTPRKSEISCRKLLS